MLRSVLRRGSSSNHVGMPIISFVRHFKRGKIEPVLDIQNVLEKQVDYAESIRLRKMSIPFDPSRILSLYVQSTKCLSELNQAEALRKEVSDEVLQLIQLSKTCDSHSERITELRLQGKELRAHHRTASDQYNAINDELTDLALQLPNLLDPSTPEWKSKFIPIFQSIPRSQHLRDKYIDKARLPNGSNLPDDQPMEPSAEYSSLTETPTMCANFLQSNGFVAVQNPLFVRSVILEALGIDPTQFLKVKEGPTGRDDKGYSAYMIGDATLPSFIASLAQCTLHGPSEIPLRLFSIGSSRIKNGLMTLPKYQIQVFVACSNEIEEEAEFNNLLELQNKFYTDVLNTMVKKQAITAPFLLPYARKRICYRKPILNTQLGDLESIGDYVSRRLLMSYTTGNRSAKFLHLVCGEFLDIQTYQYNNLEMFDDADSITHLTERSADDQAQLDEEKDEIVLKK